MKTISFWIGFGCFLTLVCGLLQLSGCALDTAPVPTVHEVAGASAEALTFTCASSAGQGNADRAAKAYVYNGLNVSEDQLHWFAAEAYWQVGGYQWNEPVLARSYFRKSALGSRVADFAYCGIFGCTIDHRYECNCLGSCWRQ